MTMAPTYPAPTHRHRSKSAPRAVRGRSPNPKELKKAAKEAKAAKAAKTRSAEAEESSFVTPPPRSKVDRSTSSSKQVKKKLKFGGVTTTDIVAENKAGDSDYPTKNEGKMDSGKANKIVAMLKKDQEPHETKSVSGGSSFQNRSYSLR